MNQRTFAEAFCEQRGIPSDRYERAVLREVLYPQARIVYPLIRLLCSQYFAVDYDLVRGAGLLNRAGDFPFEATDFNLHPANRRLLRRIFHVRASTTRLRRLVREVLAGEGHSVGAGARDRGAGS
jgi:hypothetical protein